MKKIGRLQPFYTSEFDHTGLEKFLNEHPNVEWYILDGDANYIIIEKASYDERQEKTIGEEIYERFDNYSVISIPQFNHSGEVWRRIYRVFGGSKVSKVKSYHSCTLVENGA